MGGRLWTQAEIDFVKSNFEKLKTKEIASSINRTVRAVIHCYDNLSLSKSTIKKGDIFGNLEIIGEPYLVKVGIQQKSKVKCKCKCGNEKDILVNTLQQRKNSTLSCGCIKSQKASQRMHEYNSKFYHGKTNHQLYIVWSGMKTRCYNSNQDAFKDYGARGIKVCKEWLDDFINFYNWAINNGYNNGLSLDRINNDGNYEPSNCRWATAEEQANNRRNSCNVDITAFGETKKIKDWLNDERCLVKSPASICYRLGAGWSPEDAISKPSVRS